MTEDTGETQVNKPEPKVTRELLGKLNLAPASCAAGAAVSASEVQGCETDVAKPHSEGSSGEVQARAVDVAKPQQTTVPGLAQSLEVDCRYCGGCCGNRRGLRLPRRVVELVRRVKVLMGFKYECQVINAYPELFCERPRFRRGHGLNRIKELERLLSREGQYKGSYLVKRFLECSSDSACALYLRLMVNGWLGLWFYVAGRGDVGEDDVDAYVGNIARYLGFRSVVDLVKYLRLIIQGLLIVRQTDRHAGYRDVLEVDCKICGASFKTTDPLPSFIVKLVTHFKREHGLKSIEDVEAKLRELEERESNRPEGDVSVKLFRHTGEVTQLIRLVVHRLVEVKLLERFGGVYRCRMCNADVGGAVETLAHVMNHHYDAINRLLGGRTMPSVDGFNDAVDELANLFNSGNPDAVRHTVKALVQGVVEVLNVKGAISIPMLTRVLNESEDYGPLLNSLTTGNLKPERVVAMIVETMARHGIVQVNGGVVKVE